AYEEAAQVIEESLGQPVDRLFLEFDPVPMAAASIGQVHGAVLPNGRRVAVKVQRPGAPRQIEADLNLMYQAARLAKERVRALDFIDARGLVDEFARAIRQELDYRLEARNAETFRKNFAGHPHVKVPRVYWSYTRPRVLTLEHIDGTQLADVETLEYSVENRRRLAEVLADTWMTMIFRHGFFHGDPHPGNVLVENGPDGLRYGILDWGEVGTIDRALEDRLGAFILAAAGGDHGDAADSLLDLVTAPGQLDADAFRLDVSDWLATYGSGGAESMDVAGAVEDLTRIVREHRLRMPPDLAMLGKTLIQLQGDLAMAGAELRIQDAVGDYLPGADPAAPLT
ncbi:MAG: ABC1 kinase family protein, partial [Thermoleophilia bacterium]